VSDTVAAARSGLRARAVPRAAWWLGLGAAVGLVAVVRSRTGPYNIYDEAWFLQVVDRVHNGEALYREVFYSPLPLAVDVAAGAAALFGASPFTLDMLASAIATATALMAGLAALRLGCPRTVAAAAAVATIVIAPPDNTTIYGGFATLFALAALATLVGGGGLTTRRVVLAGAFVGLAFASKQNVGALTAIAAAIGVLVGGGRGRALSLLAGAAGVVVALIVVPVAVRSSLGQLVELGFLGKGDYLRTAGVSYRATVDAALEQLRAGRLLHDRYGSLTELPSVLLPLVAFPAVAAGLVLGRGDRRGLAVAGCFAVATMIGAYPRMDYVHLSAAAPCLVVATAGAWAQIPPRLRRRADLAVLAALLAWGAVLVVTSVRAADQLTVSTLPRVDGVRLSPDAERIGEAWRRGLRPGMRVFVIRADAGFAYLVSGAVNPTRFDYPAASNIGDGELRELERQIDSGSIPYACVGVNRNPLDVPALEDLVERTMTPVRSIGTCNLYRATG
jgi:hypothetical protein